jgi:hypothetical protein
MQIIIAVALLFSGSYKLTEAVVGTAKENELKQCNKVQIENLAPCEELLQGKIIEPSVKGSTNEVK